MRLNILCVVLLVVVCMVMVESTSSKSKLKRFLIKVNSWKKSNSKQSPIHSVLSHLRNKVSIIFKRKKSSSSSKPLPVPDSLEDDVKDFIEELYKDLCIVSCNRRDYYCIKVVYRYIRPLCTYRNAQKASRALISKIGCKQMWDRKKVICKTNSQKACKLAEEVAEFCECADKSKEKELTTTESTTTEPTTTEPTTTEPTTTESTTTESITTEPTSTEPTTTESATTESITTEPVTLNPGPLPSDGVCDGFTGKCYLGSSCPPSLNFLENCEAIGYVCCM